MGTAAPDKALQRGLYPHFLSAWGISDPGLCPLRDRSSIQGIAVNLPAKHGGGCSPHPRCLPPAPVSLLFLGAFLFTFIHSKVLKAAGRPEVGEAGLGQAPGAGDAVWKGPGWRSTGSLRHAGKGPGSPKAAKSTWPLSRNDPPPEKTAEVA